ncbi:hypothetical protein [Micromonospora globbae]|uniref:hypothetical protein n=1 Tax=Micromonospora globbae TaxID=1894969 RepID=UPI00342BDA5E
MAATSPGSRTNVTLRGGCCSGCCPGGAGCARIVLAVVAFGVLVAAPIRMAT